MIHEVYDMRNKKKFSLVLSVILTAASVLPCYGATTQEKITDAQNQQAQTQSELESVQEQIDELNSKKDQSQTYLTDLNQQLEDLTKEMEQLQSQYSEKEKELEQVQKELEEAEQQRQEQYNAMKDRIQYMYESSSSNNYLAILLTSGDISEFLNRAEYIQQVSSYDREMLEAYMETVEIVESKEQEVLKEQEEIKNLQEQSDQKQEAVQEMYSATYQQLRTYSEQLDSAQASQNELMAEISAQQETLNGLIRQAKEEEIAAQKKAEEEAAAKAAAEEAARQQSTASSSQSSNKSSNTSGSGASASAQESTESSSSSSGTYLGKFRVTGYCACSICCGSWAGGGTASGTTPTPGRTIAMGGVPFGTKLMINGQVYTVEDRGTAYGHVDMFFGSHSEALAFGVQYVDVYQVN